MHHGSLEQTRSPLAGVARAYGDIKGDVNAQSIQSGSTCLVLPLLPLPLPVSLGGRMDFTPLVFFAHFLGGSGWAGTYMPGLKALSDIIDGPQQSRAVSAHAASKGIIGAASFLVAETIGAWFGCDGVSGSAQSVPIWHYSWRFSHSRRALAFTMMYHAAHC